MSGYFDLQCPVCKKAKRVRVLPWHCCTKVGQEFKATLPPPSMLGDELHRQLRWVKSIVKGPCGCEARRVMLNRWSIEQCEAGIERIVGMLRNGATELGIPFCEFVARRLVKRSIRKVKVQLAAKD